MGVIRKVASVGTLGTVGWNGQRATRAKNQKAQAELAKADVASRKKVDAAAIANQKRVAGAEAKLLKAQAKAVKRTPAVRATPAGWHPDPHGRHELRYWDGSQWTQHVSTGGQVAIG